MPPIDDPKWNLNDTIKVSFENEGNGKKVEGWTFIAQKWWFYQQIMVIEILSTNDGYWDINNDYLLTRYCWLLIKLVCTERRSSAMCLNQLRQNVVSASLEEIVVDLCKKDQYQEDNPWKKILMTCWKQKQRYLLIYHSKWKLQRLSIVKILKIHSCLRGRLVMLWKRWLSLKEKIKVLVIVSKTLRCQMKWTIIVTR